MIALPKALFAIALCSFPADGWLGVILSATEARATVLEVVPDSPAERAGLLPGDVVVAIDETATPSVEAFLTELRALRAGAEVRLSVERAGKALVLRATLGLPPGEDAPPPKPAEPRPARPAEGLASLGVRVSAADGQVAVRELIPGSAAERAGLRAGDRISRIARREVRSVADLTRALGELKPGQTVPVEVVGREGARTVDVCLDAARVSAEANHPVPAQETAAPARTRDELVELSEQIASLREEVAELRALLLELQRGGR